ncbi:MAG: HigA family addiction module antitoxin [Candidatus Anammoxibacter sp.]
MNRKVYKKKQRIPSHAGRILKSGFIDQYGLRMRTVANLLGITRGHLSRIINGHAPVTPDIALKLEILTQTPASQWLAIQSKYDMYLIEQNKEFKKYKQTLNNWVANSLPMQPTQGCTDEQSEELVLKISRLAKHIRKKKILSKL